MNYTQHILVIILSILASLNTLAHSSENHQIAAQNSIPTAAMSAIKVYNSNLIIPHRKFFNHNVQGFAKAPFLAKGDFNNNGIKKDLVIMTQDTGSHKGELLLLLFNGNQYTLHKKPVATFNGTDLPNYFVTPLPKSKSGLKSDAFQLEMVMPDGSASVMGYIYMPKKKKITIL